MLNILIAVVISLFAIPALFLILQLFVASRGQPENNVGSKAQTSLSDVIVLIPAHDEARVIQTTLDALISELPARHQIVVIADNCSDDTAQIARNCGVRVIERVNDRDKGKGFALEYGVEFLREQENVPEFVLCVDADCTVLPGSISALVESCASTGRPVQALYLMKNRNGASKKQKVAEFAWLIKNQVRPLGLMHLGLPCQLMGTGMAFPYPLLLRVKLGTANIVEDMKLGLDCAQAGYPPVFCPQARVESYFPDEAASAETQRTRWEHGHLSMIFSESLRMLKSAIAGRDRYLLAMAVDLMVPPLALLALVLLLAILITALAAALFDSSIVWPVLLLFIVGGLVLSLSLAWHRFARQVITPKELLWIPLYVISKIPVYVFFWIRRQVQWVRTDRD